MRKFASVFALILISLALFTAHSFGVVSPLHLINFQGFLTDNTGAPVADGTYDVDFYIYDVPAGGTSLWDEITTQTTSGGRFTHQLGSVNPFDNSTDNFFYYGDTLYLETVVEGEIISPRTPITSSPYSLVSAGLEIQGCCTIPGVAAIDTDPDAYTLNIYSDDGDLRARLGYYFDGALELYDESNTLQIDLDAGSTGDAAVIFPNDAISSPEIMDEPGIAHQFDLGPDVMSTTVTATDTISLTVPGNGFVVVIGNGFFNASHTSGVDDLFRVSISTTAGVHDFNNITFMDIPDSWPSASLVRQVFYIEKVTSVSSGTYTFYLNSDAFAGSGTINRKRLTAMFFPTNYGTVENTVAAQSPAGISVSATGDVGDFSQLGAPQAITVEEHNAKLAAEVAQLKAEMQARLERLERRVNQKESGTPQK